MISALRQKDRMKATQFEFRFRFLIILLIYAVGFWAPWTWTSGRFVPPPATAWLALATTLARWGWLHLDLATLSGDRPGDSLRLLPARFCACGARRFSEHRSCTPGRCSPAA